MKWPNILVSFDKGGLAIGSLKSFNLALLHKWRWCFYSNPDSLWVKVIRDLHGSEGGFDHNGGKFNGLWSRIVGSSNYLHSSSILPMDSVRFQALSVGTREELSDYRLYSQCQIEVGEDNDKCVWSLAHDGVFSVGDLRRRIDDYILPSLDTKTTWDKSLPCKVNIFIWRLKLDRLSHRLNLSSRGIDIPEISCPSCSCNVESNHYIFLTVLLPRRFRGLFGGGMMKPFLFSILTPIGSIGWIHGPFLERRSIACSLVLRLLYGSFGGIVIV
ncbi:RNA-directed DNA polymerase, eukaryota, reverse transcriptase zinc-binding domain protein [Tanacetum coccineum]|uniref:RNA-directed DNA polymerase, eukaryota, reverse transcriptase zinc-binding domain protein n=1 Tax=Tanacetum coccineum TaxID=301880 RepID=A0ABQ5DAD3_9ASTR